jgi:hypothetical protein
MKLNSLFICRELIREGKTGDQVSERDGGTIDQLDFADAEFENFILQTHKELVKLEGRRDSSLNLICRIDVSIMPDPAGNMHYFVNEVERGLTISFFSVVEDGLRVLRVADEWGPMMVGWIKQRLVPRAEERLYRYKSSQNM